MSGTKVASYVLSAAAQAALREAQRVAAARRRWQSRQRDRARVVGLLIALSGNVDRNVVSQLEQPASWDEQALAKAERAADLVTAALRAELTRVQRARTQELAETRLRGIEGAAVPVPVVPVVSMPAAPGRECAGGNDEVVRRAERYAGRLDPDAEPPEVMPELLARIRTAPRAAAEVLLARLRDVVEEANRAHRAVLLRQEAEEVLAAARVLLADTDDAELGTLLAAQEAELAGGRPVDTAAVRAAMATAEARELDQRRRRFVLLTMVDALADQDYEPITDFAVHRPVDGELVRVDGRGHAVRITVDDRIHLEPVLLGQRGESLSADERAARGRAADVEVCAAITRALVEVSEEDGLVVRSASTQAPGLVGLDQVTVTSEVVIDRERGARAESRRRRLSRRRGLQQRVREMDVR